MNYTSKIVAINKTDSFKTGDGKTMNKYVVTFANGHNPHIYALGEFKYEVGTEVTYSLDQNKNKAKIVKNDFPVGTEVTYNAKIVKNDFPRGNGVPYEPKGNYTNKDQMIIRQTCVKAASEFHAGTSSTAEDVVKTAETFLNWINND